MEIITQYHLETAALIARIFLGILFLFQGYDAVFRIGVRNVSAAYAQSVSGKGIPSWLVACGAWYTSYSEIIGGLFLILGLFQYPVMLLLGINLLIAAIGFSLASPMWDLKFAFPRLALLLFLLVLPPAAHTMTIDHLIRCRLSDSCHEVKGSCPTPVAPTMILISEFNTTHSK